MVEVGRRGTSRPGVHLGWSGVLGVVLLVLGLGLYGAPMSRAQVEPGPVYVVQIRQEIDLGLAPYLARALEQAEGAHAQAVILEIDTPGGRLDAVLQMRDSIIASPVRTIAFVNRTAFSAGALVAISANEVYLAPGAVIGAATPVTAAGETADEKAVSAVRSTFRSTAELRGRDPRIAEAMVDPAVEIEGLVTREQLLTLTAQEAQARGYANGIVQNQQELLQAAGLSGAVVEEIAPTPAENLVRVLTTPLIASLLISAGFLLIVADLFGGGIGLAGGAGAGLLALFFWGHMLAGLAGWEGIALVLLGLALLALEALVIPGFGVAGILGVVALTAGLFLSLIGGPIVTNDDLVRAGSTVGAALLTLLLGGILLFWLLPRAGRLEGLILRARLGVVDAPDGGHAKRPLTDTPPAREPVIAEQPSLLGARGVAMSDLRPGGIARIDGERVDVVTEGDYLAAGEPIEVISDEHYRRVVRRLDQQEGAVGAPDSERGP